MIILSFLRSINDILTEAFALRDQVMARYPHLSED